MKKLKALFSSIIITLFVLNNLIPIITYAAGDTSTGNGDQEEIGRVYEIKDEETWDVSKNGDESVIAKWTLNDRTLTISGSGEMKAWTSSSKEDWHSTKYTNTIEKVVIEDRVTNIGGYAFYGCSRLTNIEIPNSVTSIGWDAFYGCSCLTSIEIPNSVTSIGAEAFSWCSSLVNIKIPNSVTRIGTDVFYECSSLANIEIQNGVTSIEMRAFYGCSSLANIEIPNSVTSIGDRAFSGCSSLTNIEIPNSVSWIGAGAFLNCSSLKEIKVDNENQNYTSEDGVLFNKDKTELIRYPSDKENTTYNIPNSVISIGGDTFRYCSRLTNVKIPNSVTNIEEGAFSYCSRLTNVKIPNSVTSIEKGVFSYCSGLTNIEIPNSVVSIRNDAFSSDYQGVIICYTNSEAHRYAEEKEIWYKLQDNIESNYETKYKIREQGIWDVSAYGDESVIAKWTLEDRTLRISGSGRMKNLYENTIPWYNIKYNSLIEKVVIEEGITNIGSYVFYKCNNLKNIEMPNSITSIGEKAFSYCSGLTNVEIPNSVTSIGKSAFSYCSGLTNIEIPSSVTKIDVYTFEYCSSLRNIEIPSSVTYIDTDAFRWCNNLTNIEIPNNVKGIGSTAFSGCIGITNIEIPSSITYIGSGAFTGCSSLKEIMVNSENQNYASIDGVLYNKEKTKVLIYPIGRNEDNYVIPNSVTSIGDSAFQGCNILKNIEIPNSVTSIGKEAFYGCSSLTNIEIPSSVKSIEQYTFYQCISLKDIKIPSSINTIGYGAFENFKGPIICQTNSVAHEYAESNKIAYIIYDEAIEVEFESSEFTQPQKEVSIKVNVSTTNSELNESSLKYLWSTKEEVEKEEITNSFINGEQITSPKGITGTYSLYVYAEDSNGNEKIARSSAIVFDNTIPILNTIYSITSITNQNVTATITANEKIQQLTGWTLSSDGLKLTKNYTANTTATGEEVTIKDLVGNEAKAKVIITNIDKTAPTSIVTYSTTNPTNQSVTATITANEKVQQVSGWTLSSDELKLTKTYTANTTSTGEQVTINDLAGNKTTAKVVITNIDKTAPTANVTYSTTGPTNQNVIATITANEKVQAVEGWTLSEDGLKLTKNYTANTSETGEEMIVKDLAGNETTAKVVIANIDKTAPTATITYSPTELTKENVIATITANEKIQATEGWTLSEDGLKLTKTYTANTTATGEEVTIKDLVGNETKTKVTITNIDKTAPTAIVAYSTTNPTNQGVTATITANEEVQQLSGWNLSNNKKVLTKTYTANTTSTGEQVTINDLAGNKTTAKVVIANIDKTAPTATVTYSTTNPTNQNVTITITANEEVQQLSGWNLSNNKKVLTKTYTANTTSTGEQVTINDLAGNKTTAKVVIANIDKTAPTAQVTYSTTNPTNQNVIVTITTNEEVQQLSGWTLSNNKKVLTKTYTANTTANGEEITIKDLVGNETKTKVTITNIDKQLPTITGVEKNHRYFRKAKPEITEENIKTIELLRSGRQVEDYTNGQEIEEAGNYKLIVEDKAGNSTTRTFTIYDIETKDYKEQTIGNTNYLGKINVGTKTSQIEGLLKSVENFKITRNGAEIYSNTNRSNDQVLATGDKIEFEDQEYTLIVTGDINKDGKSNIVDLARCMKVVIGKKQLDTIEQMSADTNFDGKVNIIDLAKIRKLSLNN